VCDGHVFGFRGGKSVSCLLFQYVSDHSASVKPYIAEIDKRSAGQLAQSASQYACKPSFAFAPS
jgi:hypothetical protein